MIEIDFNQFDQDLLNKYNELETLIESLLEQNDPKNKEYISSLLDKRAELLSLMFNAPVYKPSLNDKKKRVRKP